MVATGFQKVERTLSRILFLQESADILDGVYVHFRLKQSYPAVKIGHFRAFVHLSLRALTLDILRIWFSSTDKPERYRDDIPTQRQQPESEGIAHGIAGGQWEYQLKREDDQGLTTSFVNTGWSSGVGKDPVDVVVARYSHDDGLIRVRPRLQLRDLNDAMFMPVLNGSLAEKLNSISIYANGYKLAEIGPDDFRIDSSSYEHSEGLPAFSPGELTDPWVRLRPSEGSSAFRLKFSSTNPRRLFGHNEPLDSVTTTGSDR